MIKEKETAQFRRVTDYIQVDQVTQPPKNHDPFQKVNVCNIESGLLTTRKVSASDYATNASFEVPKNRTFALGLSCRRQETTFIFQFS